MKKISLVFMVLNALIACKSKTAETPSNTDTAANNTIVQETPPPPPPPQPITREIKTSKGKIVTITEEHPNGMSMSTLRITPNGFTGDSSVQVFSDVDPVKKILSGDLDKNGYDEIYIITESAGSGGYQKVIGLASNQDKSLTPINFPELVEGDKRFEGYMGHDSIGINANRLTRTFPVYKKDDINSNPTGGARTIYYSLKPGEASWQLVIVNK